jgi:hypothetical protein
MNEKVPEICINCINFCIEHANEDLEYCYCKNFMIWPRHGKCKKMVERKRGQEKKFDLKKS